METKDLWDFVDKNPSSREEIYNMAKKGYTVDGISESGLSFIDINKLELNLKVFKNIHYSIEVPEFTPLKKPKLIVLFAPATNPGMSSAKARYFGLKQWNSLGKKVGKNVIILRIADVGFVSGSYFTLYEKEIFELLDIIKDKYKINHEEVVFYGNSRGGTGALILGITGNYKAVIADPVIDRTPWIHGFDGRFDRQFMYDFIETDFTGRITDRMCKNSYNKNNIIVVASDCNPIIFDKIKPLAYGIDLKNLKLNITLESMRKNPFWLHGLTITESVEFQLGMINYFLFE